MVGWHDQLNGRGSEQAPGVGVNRGLWGERDVYCLDCGDTFAGHEDCFQLKEGQKL